MRVPPSFYVVGLLLGLYSFSIQAQSLLTNGLVAYFPFNGNANDASGNGHDGSINGAIATNGITGAADSAYLFSASPSRSITGNGILLSNSSMTISFWFRKNYVYTGNRSPGFVIDVGEGESRGHRIIFTITQKGQAVSFDFYSDALELPTPGLGEDRWDQVVGTYDASTHERRLYVNGSLIGTNMAGGFGGSSKFWFGVHDGKFCLMRFGSMIERFREMT